MMSALDLQHYHNLLIEEGGRKRACRCAANWLEIWVLVREVSTIDKCNQPKAQRMEIKIIKQVLKKKKKNEVYKKKKKKQKNKGTQPSYQSFSWHFDKGALDWPPSVPEYVTCCDCQRKDYREREKSHPPIFVPSNYGGR